MLMRISNSCLKRYKWLMITANVHYLNCQLNYYCLVVFCYNNIRDHYVSPVDKFAIMLDIIQCSND